MITRRRARPLRGLGGYYYGGGSLPAPSPVAFPQKLITTQVNGSVAFARVMQRAQVPIGPQQGFATNVPASGSYMDPSPWIAMPSGGEPFRYPNQAAVSLGAVGSDTVVVSFAVPRGKNGDITIISNQFVGGGWTEGSGGLVWRIDVNGVAVQGYNSILASIGSMSNPADLRLGPIRIRENDFVRLILNNVSVAQASQYLLGQLGGYFYPLTQEPTSTWL